ncbi:DUF1028 domain-containing protein [Natronomonas sp. EA1]|uniref:DUF1028 domain-containing protein n=1 Tax=Natronomonas sp. EA1 TaxID=3421655 RepID=UPI003EBA03A2
MTFSICVRETYEDSEGDEQYRFGVAVTTRLAGVGALCPHANEYGAVSTQSITNVELGAKGIEYLADGLAVDDALSALLDADEGRAGRQLHGVGREGSFVFSGEECMDHYGHRDRGSFTVAGNLLAGPEVLDATADSYETSDRELPLARRLIDALAAGYAEGGDKREDLRVQSAALKVTTTEDRDMDPYYDDLRVDATPDPIDALYETFDLAVESFDAALAKYEDAYAEDDLGE